MPLGEPWRVGKRPYGRSALSTAAACLKGFYLHQAALGVNAELGKGLDSSPAAVAGGPAPLLPRAHHDVDAGEPAGAERAAPPASEDAAGRRAGEAAGDGELGAGPAGGVLAWRRGPADRRAVRAAPGRPAPAGGRGLRRVPHPAPARLPPARTTRTGPRPRPSTPGGSSGETVTGGLIKRVSPAMVHTYFDYITSEYPRGDRARHAAGAAARRRTAGSRGRRSAARRMLGRAGNRAGPGPVRPHAFRHSFASAVLTPPAATC